MESEDQQVVRELLWYVRDLALSHKTGALKALATELAGTPPPERMSKQAVKAYMKQALRKEERQ